MDHEKTTSLNSRRKSFSYAFNGLRLIFKQEPNFKLHTVAAAVVIIAGIIRHIHTRQWMAIVFAIGLVWITEAINTCIEMLCNFSCENKFHPEIKVIKDIAAAAVLISAVVSVVIGVIVFFF
jgi:diacylglycerol kinase